MRCFRTILAVYASLLLLSACAQPSETPSSNFKAIPLKGDPHIVLNTTNEMLLADITSPTGIGSARIEKTAGQWPARIVLRLHLKGLEDFKFHYGDTTVEVSVSSQADHAVREVVEQGGKTSTLSAGDPNWIAVTPAAGYFDLEAPAAFLQSGAGQFTIEWIDFYR